MFQMQDNKEHECASLKISFVDDSIVTTNLACHYSAAAEAACWLEALLNLV